MIPFGIGKGRSGRHIGKSPLTYHNGCIRNESAKLLIKEGYKRVLRSCSYRISEVDTRNSSIPLCRGCDVHYTGDDRRRRWMPGSLNLRRPTSDVGLALLSNIARLKQHASAHGISQPLKPFPSSCGILIGRGAHHIGHKSTTS